MNTLLDKMGHIAQFFVTFTVVAAFLGTIYMLLISPVDLPSGTHGNMACRGFRRWLGRRCQPTRVRLRFRRASD